MAPEDNTCKSSTDCRGLKSYHCCCQRPDDMDVSNSTSSTYLHLCEAGSTGAPESHGACSWAGTAKGMCAPITDKTHLYDLGGKVWLFPFLIKSIHTSKAVARRVASFMSRVTAQAPSERPSYDEILAFFAAVEREPGRGNPRHAPRSTAGTGDQP
jgi:hypothetical protein